MEFYPWQTELIRHQFDEWRIEEINTPWDLYLESRILQTTLGSLYHIDLIKDNKERIFSIRTKVREPIADIITMPPESGKNYWWANLRRLKTSCPMIIDNQPLIVLDIIEEKEKLARKEYIKLTELFFEANGGKLNNENPNMWASHSKKEIKRMKHSSKNPPVNLVISSSSYKDEPFRAANFEEAITLLEQSTYKDIYFNAYDTWMEEVVELLLRTPSNWPKGNWIFFGSGPKIDYYIKKVNKVIKDK